MSAAAKPVSPQDSSAPERILGDDGGRAYRRFLAWTVGDGFAMAVIEVRKPAQRRELLAWTTAEMPGARVVALDQASGKPLRPLLEQACPSPGGTDILVLTRLEDAEDRIKLCARINIQRDELTRAFPVPWVILVHPAAALEMQQHAPDFSDFAGLWLNEERDENATQTEAFEPRGLESMSLAAPAMHLSADGGSSGLLGKAYDAIILSNYDEAVDWLAQHDMHHPDARERDPLRIRLDGLLLWRRGQPAEALSRLEEARRRCEPADALIHVGLLGDIARIRAEQGDVDAALALHQEALQVYEELGDRRSRAIALGDIARLRAHKGKVDAALALHQEELQVYEELGDRRSRAGTLGDIARLRAQKGEVDAALALHQEALQVYEEL
ncbi:MAG: tetratricopeptide repeat protein, partial [Byssovorax sp.]